jgi:hypothetical protein
MGGALMKDLSAEDEPLFHHLIEEIVVRWGYEAVVGRDGNEA